MTTHNTIGHNSSLFERLTYSPETVTRDELLDALERLAAWEDLPLPSHVETPEEVGAYIEALEENQKNEDHARFDDYKAFFETIVDTWEDTLGYGNWPCPEPWDNALVSAITDDLINAAAAIAELAALKEAGQ